MWGGEGRKAFPRKEVEGTPNRNLRAELRGEWPSGPASFISFTEVKHGCVRSETGWVTFRMNDQNRSLCRPSEGTLN